MVTCVAPHVLLSVYDSNGFATAIESLKKIAIDRIYILLPEQIIDRTDLRMITMSLFNNTET